MAKMGKIYLGRPLRIKTRKELLETVKPHLHQFLRPDTGDMPAGWTAPQARKEFIATTSTAVR